MTSGHRPPSSPRGLSGFCLMAQIEVQWVQEVQEVQEVQIRSIRLIRGKRRNAIRGGIELLLWILDGT